MERRPSTASTKWKKAGGVVKAKNTAVKAFKSVPSGKDATTFMVPRIPAEVKVAVPIMHTVQQDQFRKILEVVVEHLKGTKIGDEDCDRLRKKLNMESDVFSKLVTASYFILHSAIRNKTKLSIVEKDLTECNVPPEWVSDFIAVIRRSRDILETAANDNRVRFPSLESFRWRVDVSISSSSLSRVMQPAILMEMTLGDGAIQTFEVPVEQFHDLRFNVAKLLRTMGELERHPIMKLAFDEDKRKYDEQGDRTSAVSADKKAPKAEVNMMLRS